MRRDERKGTRQQLGWKKGFVLSKRDEEKKKRRRIAKRGVFYWFNYSICLDKSSFSSM